MFGARQDPEGAYAAVIPRWIRAMLAASRSTIYGDGETSRDFCYVANVVQANLLAALATDAAALNQVYNVAVGGRTSLNGLFEAIAALVGEQRPGLKVARAGPRGVPRRRRAPLAGRHRQGGPAAGLCADARSARRPAGGAAVVSRAHMHPLAVRQTHAA